MNSSPAPACMEASASSLPQSGHCFNAEFVLEQIHSISEMLAWIERARALHQLLEMATGFDASLRKQLDHHGVHAAPAWDEETSTAMEIIICIQQDLLAKVRKAVH